MDVWSQSLRARTRSLKLSAFSQDWVWALSLASLAVLLPAIALLTGALMWGFNAKRGWRRWIALGAIVAFLGFYNGTKTIEADWYWYVEGYRELGRVNLLTFLGTGGMSIRATEPIFYLLSFLLSRVTGSNVLVFTLAITTCIYLPYGLTVGRIADQAKLSRSVVFACMVCAIVACLTFTLGLQLVRQYLAGTVLFGFSIAASEGRIKRAAVLFILGGLTHNSFLFPASVFILCLILWTKTPMRFYLVVPTMIFLGLGLGTGMFFSAYLGVGKFGASLMKDDGQLSALVFGMDLALFLMIALYLFWNRGRNEPFLQFARALLMFSALYGSFLWGMRDFPLFLLRFYFYLEFFRIIALLILFRCVHQSPLEPALVFLVISVSFIVMMLRIQHAPWTYGGDFWTHLLGSPGWWISRLPFS